MTYTRCTTLFFILAFCATCFASNKIKREDIQIRDPFILLEDGTYYLYGTTDKDPWGGRGGFDVYKSSDLENWEGPTAIFRPNNDFWGSRSFWAPECFKYDGAYYLFATITDSNGMRGTTILKSDAPDGTFIEHAKGKVTPPEWMALDGTLFVDEANQPWIVFCHEWVQIGDGAICAMPLSKDLKSAAGQPTTLFSASSAAWSQSFHNEHVGESRVTDGPFFYRNKKGELLMIWSSTGKEGYTMGIARSANGQVLGPWEQVETPLFKKDGGHGMIFNSIEGTPMVSLHHPNNTPNERPHFFEITEDESGLLKLK